MQMTPANSGAAAAISMMAQPAWQLPMTTIAAAVGMQGRTRRITCFRQAMSSIPSAWNRVGIEADEVTGMAGPHGDTDVARLLKTTDTRAMTRAGVGNDKGTLGRAYFGTFFRENAQ